MNYDLQYPINVKYFDNIDLINVKFTNNDQEPIHIYYVLNKKKRDLATIIPGLTTREYQFPTNTIVAIYLLKDLNKVFRVVKLNDKIIYIIP